MLKMIATIVGVILAIVLIVFAFNMVKGNMTKVDNNTESLIDDAFGSISMP